MHLQKIRVIHLDDTSKNVTVLPVTHVAFEREFSMAFTEAFNTETSMRLEHLMWIAWHAARTGVAFDDWLETVKGLEIDEAEAVDPTNPAQPDGQ